MYKQKIETFFKAHKEEYLKDLAHLIAIDSTRGEIEDGFPYGKGPAAVLENALQIADGFGLYTENWENYLGIVELLPGKERKLDIMAHLDVVPGGKGWTVTEPFLMKEDAAKVYGRGVIDDKGPALAVLYALRAIKELSLPIKENVRVMLGCNEESGSSELEYYFSKTSPAEMTFTPDAEFPVINIEKGIFCGSISAEINENTLMPVLNSLWGGEKANVVPAKAEAVLEGIKEEEIFCAVEQTKKETDTDITWQVENKYLRVSVEGRAAHASEPEKGKNAVLAMLSFLNRLPLNGEAAEKMRSLYHIFPFEDMNGKSAGIYMHDMESGEITVSLNTLQFDGHYINATFDSRIPLCASEAALQPVPNLIENTGFHFSYKLSKPHYVSSDSFFVKVLLECYEKYSGQEGKCLSTGGGTYVHNIDNAVAFGCSMPGEDNQIHGPDEWVFIDTLLISGMIYTEAIVRLCS